MNNVVTYPFSFMNNEVAPEFIIRIKLCQLRAVGTLVATIHQKIPLHCDEIVIGAVLFLLRCSRFFLLDDY